ncbi:T7SS effector LXG polymorphic toxin, partial [Clostridium sp. 1xD42-85]|uniref:T7SS effector LXG polymorphic toxin n=2 Tax=Clostridia TaxID=186801 RepID=UPI00256FF5CA
MKLLPMGIGGDVHEGALCKRLHIYIDKTISQLEQIHTQVKNIQKSIEAIIALEDAFKGKTANSIRTFYQEVHMPFLLFLEGFIMN